MKAFIAVASALGDPTRVRAVMLLRPGELCLCQIIDALGLAPSTISKHMTLLHAAGLVSRRKEGRWHYYRLAGREAPPEAREALAWALRSLARLPARDPAIASDAARLKKSRGKKLQALCACYRC